MENDVIQVKVGGEPSVFWKHGSLHLGNSSIGIAIGTGTGIAGIMTSMTQYNKFTSQLKSFLQKISENVLSIQKQILRQSWCFRIYRG
jgi:hypothetical protein